jgi:hypothetical protein
MASSLKITGGFWKLKPLEIETAKKALILSGQNEQGKSSLIKAYRACLGGIPGNLPLKRLAEIFPNRGAISLEVGDLETRRTKSSLNPNKEALLKKLGLTPHALELCLDQEGIIGNKYLSEILASVARGKMDLPAELVKRGCDEDYVKQMDPKGDLKKVIKFATEQRAGCQQIPNPDIPEKPARGEQEVNDEYQAVEDKIYSLRDEILIAENSISKEEHEKAVAELTVKEKELEGFPEISNPQAIIDTSLTRARLKKIGETIPTEEYKQTKKALKESRAQLKDLVIPEPEEFPKTDALKEKLETLNEIVVDKECSTCGRRLDDIDTGVLCEGISLVKSEIEEAEKKAFRISQKNQERDKLIKQKALLEEDIQSSQARITAYEEAATIHQELIRTEKLNAAAEAFNEDREAQIEKRRALADRINELKRIKSNYRETRSEGELEIELAGLIRQKQELEQEKATVISYEGAKKTFQSIKSQNDTLQAKWNAWDKIIKTCQAIEGESIQQRNPLEDRISYTASLFRMPIEVNGTEIIYQERPYDLASTSAQWRISLLVFEAVCHLYHFPMLLIDEASLNDSKFKMLLTDLVEAVKDDYEQTVIASTAFTDEKPIPPDHPWAEKLYLVGGMVCAL